MKSKLYAIFLNILRKIYNYLVASRCKKCGSGLKVNGYSRVTPNTYLGNNVNFNGMKIDGHSEALVKIGNNFHSGPECRIIASNHDFDKGEAIPYGKENIIKDVIIEDNVWLGTRVIVLGGVCIGEGVIIQAGSVVVNDIPKYGIAGGHPAKVFKYRDIEHYERLKSENQFH